MKLGLVILACFAAEVGRAQFTFATAANLSGDSGSVVNDNTGVTPDLGAPNIAGFPANMPLWYQWTPSVDGEVELDTIGSVDDLNGTPLNTVLGVFTGTSLATLNQVAANDDLFPINSSISLVGHSFAQINQTGSGDYAQFAPPGTPPVYPYIQLNYGPSHLRFNAKAGTTYYIAVDSQAANYFLYWYLPPPLFGNKGAIVLNWAYKSSGVFRFASEDVDITTGLLPGGNPTGYPLYQTSQTESYPPAGTANDANSAILTYYQYNVPGLLVTVTRVAGSVGRAMVDYQTVDGASLPFLPIGDVGAVSDVDYTPVSGTLVFDDYEMSKTILIPIIYTGSQTNSVFGVQLIDDGGATSPTLDPFESSAVSQPRVDPNFSLALVKILSVEADPYGPDTISVVSTNGYSDPPANTIPILETNDVPTEYPTNVIINFAKANYRVPADVNNMTNGAVGWTKVVIYAERFGTNTSAITLNYRVNNDLGYDKDNREEMNFLFPLQPGSDYAVPTPETWSPIRGTNSDFDLAQGTISFPSSGSGFAFQPISFTVTNSTLTKFNKDFKIELYRTITVGGQSVPALAGMVGETTVTILFNDLNPPAGSVDEFYNADFNTGLAVPPGLVPQTIPQNDGNPGVSGVVNSLLVLADNKTLIAGDFVSYNGSTYPDAKPVNCIALINTNGALDSSFEPASGASGPINSLASSPGGQFVIGGAFTSFNGVSRNHIARVNADGSLDAGFNPAANGTVWAAAVLSDGKVLIGGDFNNINGQTRNHLARLNADGTLDTTFDPGTTLNGPVYAIALPPSVIAAISRSANGNSNEDDQVISIGNYTSGSLNVNYDMFTAPDDMRIFYGDTNVTAGTGVLIYDTGYVSGSNTLVIPFGPTNGLATNLITIVMDQGGQTNITQWKYTASVAPLVSSSGIFVGGDFGVSGQSYADIARFTPNGSLDTTFNPTAGADNPIYTLGWQLDGKVVVGGSFTHFNGSPMNRIARLNGNGSLDTTNFFVGTGANDVVWNLTLQPLDGTMYVGGQFSSFNGTHRLGFTRLYANGTVDTTFLDTAYNQFAGLKRIYSYDVPAIYASGVQSDGNVIIGGTFDQVGGGQADINVCNTLDDELGIDRSFNDPNLWVEPKTRDGVRNRSSVARLIGGSTPGPGNIGLQLASFSANKSSSVLSVGLVRTNGMLGPVSANFSVQPSTALSGRDFSYNSAPPLFWVAWEYITTPTRTRGDGLFGVNGFLQDVFNFLSQADVGINRLSAVTVSIIKNNQSSGNLNAQFQLANPSGADEFYLGGQNIPLGAALGPSVAPFTVIDDNKQSGVLGFASPVYTATNIGAVISLVRSNGTYGTVTMRASTINGTAIWGTDYNGITNLTVTFLPGVVTNSFTVTNKPSGLISTNFVEKFLNLRLSNLTGPSDGGATFGLSNAVLRLINPNFQGYLTLSATNYIGSETAGFITFVVNRVAGSAGQISVRYATTNGTAINGVDYIGATNTLQWNNGDASPRTVSISLTNNGTVGTNKQFGVYLFNPTNGLVSAPSLFYVGTPPNSTVNAALTITNDNSYGAFQFSAPSYLVSENGGYATITVVRTGGMAGPVSVNFATSNGPNTSSANYDATNGVLTFVANQTAVSFNVTVRDDGVQDPASFYFNVSLSNPTNAVLGSPTNAAVNILDAETYNWAPGSPDGTFTAGMNGDVLALALQPNGQILVGGNFTYVNGTPDNGIARLNVNGSLDSAGFLNGLAGANGAVQAVVCQTDGRVVIGGAFTSADGIARNHIARLMTDGSLDTSFNPGPGADGPVYALAETFVNGVRKIYVGGSFSSISGGTSPNFARFNNDGTLDPSFNSGSGPNATVFALAVYPTNSLFAGKVLIGGAFTNVNNFALNHIARLNGDGSVDTNFDLNLGANDTVRAIVIQIDGRILIGGDFTNVNGVALNRIARLNADGSLDATFTSNVGVGVNSTVQAIAVQADNRIVLAGQFTLGNGVTRNRITRLLPNGAVDATINFGDGANGAIDALVIQPANQMLVIGGGFTQYDDQPHAHIARIYGGSVTGSGLLQFTSAGYQVDEKGGQVLITIQRTGGTSGPNADGSGNISLNFATTSGGSAVAGVNYTAVATTVNFPPGEVLETVAVPVMDDGVVTPDLTVNLAISNPTAPAGIGAQPVAVLTIINNDSAVSFSTANYSVAKNVATGFAPIDVLRLGTTNGTCSVDFVTTTDGSAVPGVDFYPTNTTITFNPGDTAKQIQVPIINNSLPEGYRTVIFALTNAVNTALVSPSNATLTIIDTVYAPGQLSFSTTNYTAYESDGSAYLTVVRTNGTSGTVTVAYDTVAGTALPGLNYVNTSGTLSFNDGDVSKTFAVPLVNNNIAQGPVSLSVVLSNPSGGAVLIAPANATLTLLHTNIGVAFVNVTNYVRETNGLVPILVQRFGGASSSVQVNYATANGTAVAGVNYTAVSGILTFNAGETLAMISLPLLYDPQVTGNLALTMSLSSPSAGVQLASPSNTVIVVQDADAGLSFTTPASSVYKNAGSAVITVVCSNPGVEPLSVHYSTTNGTAVAGVDYTATSGTLVFTGGVGTNTFSVPILTNSLVNGNHTLTVSLSNPTPPGRLVSPSNQVVTIIDSNSGLSFSSPTYTVLKTGVAATITVLRIENTNTVSSVNFATANGTAVAGLDYIATNGTCVFTNGETSKTFSVTVINNTVVQPDKTVLLQLSSPTNGILIAPYGATLTIHDTSGSLVVPAGSTLISESGPTNGIIDPGETVSLWFAFRAAGGNNVSNLVATLLATNGVTFPSGPQTNYGLLIVGGPSASLPFSFTASGTNSQSIAATFQFKSGTNNLGTAVFTYTLGTSINTFANTNLIIINDHASASPYPSTINVSGVGGLLIKATVTFANLTHSWPADIDALLESPSQQSALLMAHAGGGFGVHGVTLMFDDAASTYLPQTQIVSGTYRPTAFILSPAFSPPAPATPYATNLSSLYDGNPNGAWSLFVIDDAAINAGAISNGWSLTLITSSPVGSAADSAISMTASPNPVGVSNNLTFVIAVTNYGPSASTGVTVTNPLPSGALFVSATNSQGTVSTNSSLLTWNVGPLAANAGATLTLVLRPTAAGSVTNSAIVSSVTSDPNPDDNAASVTVTVGVSSPPQFGSLVISNGTFRLTITNPTNPPASIIIQASTNLFNWVNIFTSTPPFTFTDPSSTNYPSRFYRAVLGP
jgi:uncharacterized delta-60 repeat protein